MRTKVHEVKCLVPFIHVCLPRDWLSLLQRRNSVCNKWMSEWMMFINFGSQTQVYWFVVCWSFSLFHMISLQPSHHYPQLCAIGWERQEFSFSYMRETADTLREGNGNPLQYSCLKNPMGRGAWWAAVRGVAQGRSHLKWLSMHACIGEGNGNPLQYSCLENPRDKGAWWAAIYGVAQSRTRLKWLSSSSSSRYTIMHCAKGDSLLHK